MKGGKRKGAGNKEGSVRPKITDHWSQSDIDDYFVWLKKNYQSNPRLVVWVGDHLMGKAMQPIGNDDNKPFLVKPIMDIANGVQKDNSNSEDN